jgi:PIN domain nuclease of toxin-antitoxin system
LLDTHTFLWAVDDSPQLSGTVRGLIEITENTLFLSVASLWEIANKVSTGKLKLELPFLELAAQKTYAHDVALLPIAPEHLDLLTALPFHHRDPFNRLIVAQCMFEDVLLLSRDGILDNYPITRVW